MTTHTPQQAMEDNIILLLSDAHGIHIPQVFAQDFNFGEDGWQGVSAEERDVLADPGHENYWRVRGTVLNNAHYFDESSGKVYHLYQEGNLWALCLGKPTEEEKLNFRGGVWRLTKDKINLMSDDELNYRVAKILGDVAPSRSFEGFVEHYARELDYTRHWSLASEIVEFYVDKLFRNVSGTWTAVMKDGQTVFTSYADTNPLRAMVKCLILHHQEKTL